MVLAVCLFFNKYEYATINYYTTNKGRYSIHITVFYTMEHKYLIWAHHESFVWSVKYDKNSF